MGRRNKSKIWDTRSVGLLASVMLGGALLALLFPTAGKGALAADCTSDSSPDSPECTMRTGVNTNLTTTVRSSIAVALSAAVELDVTPKARGAFSTSKAEMQITTNNTTGYAVYLQTADNTSELKAANPQVSEAIMPVEGSMTETNYDNNLNTWGYAIGAPEAATQYKAVPKSGDEAILKTEGVSREDSYDVAFAVVVGADLPAGVYTNELLVSVVANPIEVRSLNDLNYMQDMTAEICNITFEGEAKQLIDIRDGKSYKVAKLKDGNCWMVENLGLTATAGGRKLTPSDTDIIEEWTLPETLTTTGEWSNTDDQAILSMNIDNGIGTYFTFHAATAQTELISGNIAAGSVCPKGWKIPLAGEKYNSTSGSYYNLLNAYGLAKRVKSIAGQYTVFLPNGNTVTNTVTEEQYNINSEPLNIQRSGIVQASTGEITYNNAAGQLWSSVKFGSEQIYAFSYDGGGGVSTSYNNDWFSLARFGKQIRCVVRQ